MLLCVAARAQESAPSTATQASRPARTLIVQNLAPHARQEWCVASVPFAQGEASGAPALVVDGHETVWQPFGARWPDGSLRFTLCLFRCATEALQEKELRLVPGTPLGGELAPEPAPDLTFVVVQAGREKRAKLTGVRVLERNVARCVTLFRARIEDTGLVAEAIVERYRDQEHEGCDVALFFSDTTSKEMVCPIGIARVESRGHALLLRHAGPFAMDTEFAEDGTKTTLLRDTMLADGQGIRRAGVLVPALRGQDTPRERTLLAAACCPLLAATDWRASRAFGAFGIVPEPPPWLAGARLRQALAARHARFVEFSKARGEPFMNGPHGLARRAGQTGDQEDFGVCKLGAIAATGLPSFLLEVELSVLQEACRPVHCFEPDGAPLQSAAHPDWVVWSGRTHWHCDVSKDRLGKPCPEPAHDTHGWTGKDRQHWSSNYIAGYYLLTGKHWALAELENEVQLFLAGETIDPRFSTSGTDAPRAGGRTLLAGAWLWLCTGSTPLLVRMRERVAHIYAPVWEGHAIAEGKVRPYSTENPDARMLDGKTPFWTPWQDALAAIGFRALWQVSGDPQAKEIGDALARSVTRHGWLLDNEGRTIIATAIRWLPEGTPPSAAELASSDKSVVVWSHGTAFSEWTIGSLEIARLSAIELGDKQLEARAAEIQRRVRAARVAPRDGWFDRLPEWDAVR